MAKLIRCVAGYIIVVHDGSEAPGVSTLLLFETVPWVTPHQAFFPHLSGSFPGEGLASIIASIIGKYLFT